MDELTGKTAVITGAASGMGLAFATRFAAAGMNVVLSDVEEPALEAAAAAVGAVAAEHGNRALGLIVDVSDEAAVTSLAERAIDEFGRVNVVCNNAGVAGQALAVGAEHIAIKDWKWVIDVNLWGVIHGHQAFLPHLLEHGDGHIVNTASTTAHLEAA
ncbi:MAG: SDR family NAD(P)-dependent oxidoreductase [Actinomycetota bacterium]